MVVTPAATFMHIPKTAGQWVMQVLGEARVERVDHHQGRAFAPADRPVFGFVRDPFAWYVSWYEYYRRTAPGHPLLGGASPEFKDVLAGLLTPTDALRTRLAKRAAMTQGAATLLGVTPGQAADWRAGESYYTFLRRQHLAGADRIGRVESIAVDLAAMLESVGMLDAEISARIASLPPVNTSRHGDPMDYYSADQRAAVMAAESDLVAYYA